MGSVIKPSLTLPRSLPPSPLSPFPSLLSLTVNFTRKVLDERLRLRIHDYPEFQRGEAGATFKANVDSVCSRPPDLDCFLDFQSVPSEPGGSEAVSCLSPCSHLSHRSLLIMMIALAAMLSAAV